MKKSNVILNIALPIIVVGCIIALWWGASSGVNSEYVLPSPALTFSALISLLSQGEFYLSLLWTFLRSIIAFTISFIIAVALGYLSTKYNVARKIISPIISIVRALPTIAVGLLLYFWTTSSIAAVIVTMLVVLPTLFTNVYNAVASIDYAQIEMCRLYKVKERDIAFKVVLPQIAPSIITSIGSGLSLNLKLMVAAEVICQTAVSLGYMLNSFKMYYEIAYMIAVVLIVVIIGVVIESIFNLIAKKVGRYL